MDWLSLEGGLFSKGFKVSRLTQVSKTSNLSLIPCIVYVCVRNLERLSLSDLPGVKDKVQTVDRLKTAHPKLTIELDLA